MFSLILSCVMFSSVPRGGGGGNLGVILVRSCEPVF